MIYHDIENEINSWKLTMIKYLLKFLSFLFIKKKETPDKTVNEVSECLHLFTELSSSVFIDQTTLSFTYINTRISNVENYIELLDSFTRKIKNAKVIKPDEVPDYKININLDMFFIDKDKNYLDPLDSLTELINSTISFCHELIIDQEEIGIHEHNRIVTMPIITNLIDIAKTINK